MDACGGYAYADPHGNVGSLVVGQSAVVLPCREQCDSSRSHSDSHASYKPPACRIEHSSANLVQPSQPDGFYSSIDRVGSSGRSSGTERKPVAAASGDLLVTGFVYTIQIDDGIGTEGRFEDD